MPHRLLDRPEEPAIQWRTSGGLLGGADETPDLEIWADGRARVSERLARGRRAEARLPSGRVQELLRVILDEHHFFDLDSEQIEEQLDAERARRAGRPPDGEALEVSIGPPFTDAGVTHISVAADDRRHEVVVPGLFAAAQEYPEVPGVSGLREIETVLLGLAEEIAERPG